MKSSHIGRVEDYKSICSCGFSSRRQYHYEARRDLLIHYEKAGTIRHSDGIFDRIDVTVKNRIQKFLAMGLEGQEANRHLL